MGSRQRGDTIVEVLICISIVGVVLTGAFVSAQRSTQVTQQSQERIEALKLAEKQVELVRKAASNNQARLFSSAAADAQPFCLDVTGVRTAVTGLTADPQSDTFAGYGVCMEQPNGGTQYFVAVERTDFPATPTFTAHVRWEKAGGGEKQEATVAYRLYEGQ